MKIASFNVNSIRARMPRFLEWVDESQPDVIALQETKVEDDLFPFSDLEETGYEIAIHGQKRYNGVALFTKGQLEDVENGFGDDDWPEDCRIIRGIYKDILIVNTYVPNGTRVGIDKWEYKMAWLENFRKFMDSLGSTSDKIIWLGDINIAPTENDVFESEKHLGGVGHHPDEFSRLEKIVDWGFTDCCRKFESGPGPYTFWDFRGPYFFKRDLGWRIDHIYASDALKDSCTSCWVDRDTRAQERPSDHAPILAEFDL